MLPETDRYDVLIVGGGLAGLTAAATLTRAGASALVLERSATPGGRARSLKSQGFHLDLGPHALYQGGAAMAVLKRLNITPEGAAPPLRGVAVDASRVGALPMGMWSLLTTPMLSARARWPLARFMARLPSLDASPWMRQPWSAWLDEHLPEASLQKVMHALARLVTYTDAPDLLSAGAVLEQLRISLAGVLYLDGGWSRLVAQIQASGGPELRVQTGARIQAVRGGPGAFEVETETGEVFHGRRVILAIPPAAVDALMGTRLNETVTPARVSCMAVALGEAGITGPRFALGLDTPFYLSEFGRAAQVAPEGHGLIHVVRYLAPGLKGGHQAELEGILDRLHPGWRAHTVQEKRMGQMTVTHALPEATRGGLSGRPGPELAPGVDIAGDWVGPTGLLADAALASGEAAALKALAALYEMDTRAVA